jgi:hypothetical protein
MYVLAAYGGPWVCSKLPWPSPMAASHQLVHMAASHQLVQAGCGAERGHGWTCQIRPCVHAVIVWLTRGQ